MYILCSSLISSVMNSAFASPLMPSIFPISLKFVPEKSANAIFVFLNSASCSFALLKATRTNTQSLNFAWKNVELARSDSAMSHSVSFAWEKFVCIPMVLWKSPLRNFECEKSVPLMNDLAKSQSFVLQFVNVASLRTVAFAKSVFAIVQFLKIEPVKLVSVMSRVCRMHFSHFVSVRLQRFSVTCFILDPEKLVLVKSAPVNTVLSILEFLKFALVAFASTK